MIPMSWNSFRLDIAVSLLPGSRAAIFSLADQDAKYSSSSEPLPSGSDTFEQKDEALYGNSYNYCSTRFDAVGLQDCYGKKTGGL